MCEEVHFSKFAGLQAYSCQLYLQMNSFTGIFQHHFKPPHAPHVLTQAPPPPSNFEEPPCSQHHVLNTGVDSFLYSKLCEAFLWPFNVTVF